MRPFQMYFACTPSHRFLPQKITLRVLLLGTAFYPCCLLHFSESHLVTCCRAVSITRKEEG